MSAALIPPRHDEYGQPIAMRLVEPDWQAAQVLVDVALETGRPPLCVYGTRHNDAPKCSPRVRAFFWAGYAAALSADSHCRDMTTEERAEARWRWAHPGGAEYGWTREELLLLLASDDCPGWVRSLDVSKRLVAGAV